MLFGAFFCRALPVVLKAEAPPDVAEIKREDEEIGNSVAYHAQRKGRTLVPVQFDLTVRSWCTG